VSGASLASAPAEGEHAVPERLGPNPELAAVLQEPDDGIGHLADADLQGRAVADERGDPRGDRHRLLADWSPRGREELLLSLEGEIDRVEIDLAVAEGVGHGGVALGDDEAAVGPGLLEGCWKDVDLNTERHPTVAWHGGVDEQHVRPPGDGEQPRHEREAHREVVESLVAAHRRADEGRLVHDAGPVGEGRLRVQDEEPVALNGGVEEPEEAPRGGEVAAHHNPGLGVRKGSEAADELLLGNEAHRPTIGVAGGRA
jgi:hypothetical protein